MVCSTSPRLSGHIDEPFVEVSPSDIETLELINGGLARLTSAHGDVTLRVRVSPGQRKGELFAPIHWNEETASHGRVGALVHPDRDPHSGQPDLKATPVSIAPVHFSAHGFLLSRDPIVLPEDFWWARAAVEGGTRTRFATNAESPDWAALGHQVLGAGPAVERHDETQQTYRAAFIHDERLWSCIYLAADAAALPGLD